MQPPFCFQDVILEELLRNDRDIFSSIGEDIEDSLTRDQDPGLRISDVGSCSLALWAKIQGEFTLPRNPQEQWSRLMAGSMFGALLGRIFAAAMRRRDIACDLEVAVELDGMSGHIDIVLPEYQHLYELKSNYNVATKEPSPSHLLQAGMYIIALGDEYTASVVMIQPTIAGARPRLIEYPLGDYDALRKKASEESFRLRRSAGSLAPPQADVLSEEKWRCNSCQYGSCSQNKNSLKGVAFKN